MLTHKFIHNGMDESLDESLSGVDLSEIITAKDVEILRLKEKIQKMTEDFAKERQMLKASVQVRLPPVVKIMTFFAFRMWSDSKET